MLRSWRPGTARFRALLRTDAVGVRAGFVALLLSSGGDLLAGLTLGSITGTLHSLPGLLVLVPAAIGMRGNVFGALGSRLGTLIHTGTFRVSRRLTTPVGQNVAASLVLLAITIGVASQCAQRRWDLDNVAAPIVTAAGDVATLPSLFVATYLLGIHFFTPVIAG